MSDQEFYNHIERFNEIYRLPSNATPALLGPERVRNFQAILQEEVEEGGDLAAKYEAMLAAGGGTLTEAQRLDVMTEMSDWLGDLVVYCASEARRWGVPLAGVLEVIMQSNFSKLGADGLPIYDERGKVMKGPNYWKPEPQIRDLLAKLEHDPTEAGR